MKDESAFTRRKRLFNFIQKGNLGKEIIGELLPEGKPHEYEKHLWDYKEKLPVLPIHVKPSKKTLEEYNLKICETIKDVVSFYNSYGGYLLIGVCDHPRKIVGFDEEFDCDELNKRVKAVTKHEIDCHYTMHIINVDSEKYKIGLLFIPRRADNIPPAQFLRNAPVSKTKKRAFANGDIYFREGCECKPAKTSEDFTFLCSQDCRFLYYPDLIPKRTIIDNNLREKDPGFIKFIGRDEYLTRLWRWLFEKYTPAKLITGLGGVGKTTIAREFCEDIIRTAPISFDRVVWLSAKQRFYTAILDKYQPVSRIDFYDLFTLLHTILEELGWPKEQIDKEWTHEELIENVIETLIEIPVFLVIDDIDSLDLPEQHDVFQTIVLIFGQTVGRAKIASKALLTARLDLGAAPKQFIVVKGLLYNEFVEYINVMAKSIGLKIKFEPKTKLVKKFYKVTDGSPTFASSILSLLTTGDNLNSVLDKWKGSHGEEVRKFAFKKELKNLTDSQLRTLYAGCILGETSLIELRQITVSSEILLKDDISELKQYHLVSLGTELPTGGSRLIVPNSIRLMTDLIKDKIKDPKRIEGECVKLRAGAPKLEDNIGMVIHRVIALWKELDYQGALEVARWGNKKFHDNGNIKCLLGRAYMNIEPADPRRADKMFRRAYELKCKRPELFELWIDTKLKLQDWMGLIEITDIAENYLNKPSYSFLRVESYGKVAESARNANNLPLAAEYYLKGGKEINFLLKNVKYSSRKYALIELRNIYFNTYVKIIDDMAIESRNYVETWVSIHDVFNHGYLSEHLLIFGIDRLTDWWDSVLERTHYNYKALNLLELQTNRISKWIHMFINNELFSDRKASDAMEKFDNLKKLTLEYIPDKAK